MELILVYTITGLLLVVNVSFFIVKYTIFTVKNFVLGHYIPSESIYTLFIHLIMTKTNFETIKLQFEKSFKMPSQPLCRVLFKGNGAIYPFAN